MNILYFDRTVCHSILIRKLLNIKKRYIQVSQKWRTNGVLRYRRDHCKREKNVKEILLDLFADLGVFESGI
jgi:hypothetical protein